MGVLVAPRTLVRARIIGSRTNNNISINVSTKNYKMR